MARYLGPVCKLCRREGTKLYLKGERCFSEKCAVSRRPYPPGQHGQGRIKLSEYGLRLREKQKVRRIYGLLEKQFAGYYFTAAHMKGPTGEEMLGLIERRLDNVVHRMGFAVSRAQARQLVRHNHILVNGKRVNIASYRVKEGDVIAVRDRSRQLAIVLEAVGLAERDVPDYLDVDHNKMTATFVRTPALGDVPYPVVMEPNLVVEFYSR